MQFTIEAVVLSALGGILGVALGWVVAYEARDIFGIPTQVPNWPSGSGSELNRGRALVRHLPGLPRLGPRPGAGDARGVS